MRKNSRVRLLEMKILLKSTKKWIMSKIIGLNSLITCYFRPKEIKHKFTRSWKDLISGNRPPKNILITKLPRSHFHFNCIVIESIQLALCIVQSAIRIALLLISLVSCFLSYCKTLWHWTYTHWERETQNIQEKLAIVAICGINNFRQSSESFVRALVWCDATDEKHVARMVFDMHARNAMYVLKKNSNYIVAFISSVNSFPFIFVFSSFNFFSFLFHKFHSLRFIFKSHSRLASFQNAINSRKNLDNFAS